MKTEHKADTYKHHASCVQRVHE